MRKYYEEFSKVNRAMFVEWVVGQTGLHKSSLVPDGVLDTIKSGLMTADDITPYLKTLEQLTKIVNNITPKIEKLAIK